MECPCAQTFPTKICTNVPLRFPFFAQTENSPSVSLSNSIYTLSRRKLPQKFNLSDYIRSNASLWGPAIDAQWWKSYLTASILRVVIHLTRMRCNFHTDSPQTLQAIDTAKVESLSTSGTRKLLSNYSARMERYIYQGSWG